jgi:Tfp pilus assembly protein PilN
MNNKALYWIALAAFACGLNREYRDGEFAAVHRFAGRAEAVLCRIATHAEQSLAMVRILTERPRPEFRVDDQFLARQQAQVERVMAEHQAALDRAMALRQVDLDRVQEKLDRMHAALDRAQFEKLRTLERTRFHLSDATSRRMIVICPKTGARISVNAAPDLSDVDADVSDIE